MSNSMLLRDYQLSMLQDLYRAWGRKRSVMVQMPTGTGKTVVLAEVIRREMDCGGHAVPRVLVVAHRRELIGQISQTLDRFGIGHVVPGTTAGDERVCVGSIQKLNSGRTRTIDGSGRTRTDTDFVPTLVIVDEAHHALAKTYRQLWERWPKARFLGLTATPCRLGGEPFTDLFDVLLQSRPIQEFIDKGWLSDFEYVSAAPDSEALRRVQSLSRRGADGDYQTAEMATVMDCPESIEHLYRTYREFAGGKKGIVYAIDREHARHIATYYNNMGVKCAVIDSKTPAKERLQIIEDFRLKTEENGLKTIDVRPKTEEKGLKTIDVRPKTEDKGLKTIDVRPKTEDKGLKTVDVRPKTEDKGLKTIDVRPKTEDKGLKTIDVRPKTEDKGLQTEDFRLGAIDVLVNVDIFSEGFDCPEVEFIQLARPTLSLNKYLQQVGRGMRVSEGKPHVLILDNVGLYQTFGLPTEERDWKRMFLGQMPGKGDTDMGRCVVLDEEGMNGIHPTESERQKELVNLQMVRIKKCGKRGAGLEVFLKGGRYGVMNSGRVTCPARFKKIVRLNDQSGYYAAGIFGGKLYGEYVEYASLIDKKGKDLNLKLFRDVVWNDGIFYSSYRRPGTRPEDWCYSVFWDPKGNCYYDYAPEFREMAGVEVAYASEHFNREALCYKLRYSTGKVSPRFRFNEVFYNRSIVVARDYLIVKKDHNHAYHISAYLDDSILVQDEEQYGFRQFFMDGRKGEQYKSIPPNAKRTIQQVQLGQKLQRVK